MILLFVFTSHLPGALSLHYGRSVVYPDSIDFGRLDPDPDPDEVKKCHVLF